jgi:SAM-dependent methyltransferase
MVLAAEANFRELERVYKYVYGDYPDLSDMSRRIAAQLRPNSLVLDVGCGAGLPVAETLACAGHRVHGIDVSQKMVHIARNLVLDGTFEVADMRTYVPDQPFDVVVAMFSLGHMPAADRYSMAFKFADWSSPDGRLVLGICTGRHVFGPDGKEDGRHPVFYYDEVWDGFEMRRRNNSVQEFWFTSRIWRRLLAAAGFRLESGKIAVSKLVHPEGTDLEIHEFFVARKIGTKALLGPLDRPLWYRPAHNPFRLEESRSLADRVEGAIADKLSAKLQHNKDILEISGAWSSEWIFVPLCWPAIMLPLTAYSDGALGLEREGEKIASASPEQLVDGTEFPAIINPGWITFADSLRSCRGVLGSRFPRRGARRCRPRVDPRYRCVQGLCADHNRSGRTG